MMILFIEVWEIGGSGKAEKGSGSHTLFGSFFVYKEEKGVSDERMKENQWRTNEMMNNDAIKFKVK